MALNFWKGGPAILLLFLVEKNFASANSEDQNIILDLFKRPYETSSSETGVVLTSISAFDLTPDIDPVECIPRAASIPKDRVFTLFNNHHLQAAKELINYFSNATSVYDLGITAAGVKEGLHPELFNHALAMCVTWNHEFQHVRLPSILETFPHKFVDESLLVQAKQTAMRKKDSDEPIIITQTFTATMGRPENRLSFFREDYGVNSHHWHWHRVNPIGVGRERDRKGELFYYMHHEMLGRYNIERITAGLEQVNPLNWRQPIAEGYFPKITFNNLGQKWGSRQDYTTPRDITRTDAKLQTRELETWYERIIGAIDQGHLVTSNGTIVVLTDDVDDIPNQHRGIELLGDAIEADPDLSLNYRYYGNLHNMAHNLLSTIHDPDGSHGEPRGVLSDVAVAVRDPLFYQHHTFIDSIFERYKSYQRPYERKDLEFQGLKITQLNIDSSIGENELQTFYRTSNFAAENGLDFNGKGVTIQATHLDHQQFTYHIEVTSDLQVTKNVAVRIFLAPKYGTGNTRLDFKEQKNLWVEMDKFYYEVNPGYNYIEQKSVDSSIIGFEENTYASLRAPGSLQEVVYRGCGWPRHMLLPKGKPEGMDFELFVMLTDFDEEQVAEAFQSGIYRKDRFSHCGVLGEKYPDKRPMGFPFDRISRESTDLKPYTTLDFARPYDNMIIQNIRITFKPTTD